MDFNQLEYVIAIAEEKSISKAAKRLYISQPSLSQYIIRLENKLGVKLFDRTASSLILTFAGKKYVETAKNILSLNKQLEMELSDIAGSKKGHLSIGVPFHRGRYILPLILPQFHKQFPEIELEVEENVTTKLEEKLIAGEIDIAILNLPIQNEKIIYEPISVEKVFLVAPKNHPICKESQLKSKNKINFSDLKDEKFILLEHGQRMRLVADQVFDRAQIKPNVVLEIKNLDTANSIANAGMGFTFVPENVVWLSNTNKSSNYFLIDDITYTLVIGYRQGEYLTKATTEFIKSTKNIMESEGKRVSTNKVYNKIYI